MKVCVIGTRGFPDFIGGIETVCNQLYQELVNIDSEVEIVVVTRKISIKDTTLSKRIKLVLLPAIAIPGLENALHTLISIIYCHLFVRPHILHLHGIGPGFFTRFSRITRSKVIVTHHAADYERPKWGKFAKWFLQTGEKEAYYHADAVVCVSEAIKTFLKKKYSHSTSKIITIRNAGSLAISPPQKKYEKKSENNGYILFVGRLEASKGIHDLIRAFKKSQSPRKLYIVGEAIDNEDYLDSLKHLSNENVCFKGALYGEELYEAYRHADVVINPAFMEGYCLVVAEAISMKKPVILSNIPPHLEFQLPRQSYFPPGDIEELSKKLSKTDYTEFLNQSAYELQISNTWTKNAEAHLALYKDLIW